MSEKGPYAPPPEMQGGGDYKGPGGPSSAQQAGFVPYATYASPSLPPTDMHVPNTDSDPIVKGFQFSDETIRKGFIRKVYSILSVQLMCTFGFVMLFSRHEEFRYYAANNMWMFILSLVVVLVTIISLSCCEGVRRTAPTNMIFLAIFTIGESVLVGYCTIQYEKDTVMLAVGVTAVVVIALTAFAFQTKWDFTMMGGLLFVGLWLLIMFSFVMMFWRNQVAQLIFSCLGALLFCAYLIHDTQLIMGGDHKFSMSPEEYILGAITLFLDIINIFLYILRILGAATKN